MKSKREGTGERIEREKKYGKTSREWIKEKERWVKKTHQRFLSQNARPVRSSTRGTITAKMIKPLELGWSVGLGAHKGVISNLPLVYYISLVCFLKFECSPH